MIQILDQGYVQFIESWGSDERVIESARMSTGKGFQGWGPKHVRVPSKLPSGGDTIEEQPGDEKLLRFLWENKHATPFEMAGMTIEVKAPIFVFREWMRHRTQSFSEVSARYTPLPDENYLPTLERCKGDPTTTNKQAQGTAALASDEYIEGWRLELAGLYDHAQQVYEEGLKFGIPKEIARLPVPVARYSRMRASTDLRNWLGFLMLRMASGAQWEIRQYANAVGSLIAERFPRTWELFAGGR